MHINMTKLNAQNVILSKYVRLTILNLLIEFIINQSDSVNQNQMNNATRQKNKQRSTKTTNKPMLH